MPRGRKKTTEEVTTYAVSENANNMTGTESSKMRVYTSKPKKTSDKKSADAKSAEAQKSAEPTVTSFVHITVYCIPESKQFIIENAARGEGKSAVTAPASYFVDSNTDLEAVNAILGMHFEEESKGAFEMIRQGITQDSENIRVFQICEIGIAQEDGKMKYTYLTY